MYRKTRVSSRFYSDREISEKFRETYVDFNLFYGSKNSSGNIPALNRYPTELTPASYTYLIWYLIFLWQAAQYIYSIISIFRKTGEDYFYKSPNAMNKWCFFYSAFSLLMYVPQLTAAVHNYYNGYMSIFRHVGTFFEVTVVLVFTHIALADHLNDYMRLKLFVDIWLARLLYHNGIALLTCWLYFETVLSIVIAIMDDSFKNIDFSKQTYWNKRFECEDEYEWFCNFDRLNPVLKEYFINSSMTNHLLHLGCGTSQLAEHLYNKGYCKWITNIDYSPQVMEKMLKKSTYHNINWLVVDIRLMPFVNNTFDIIIEKGTLDVFFVGEHDLWHPSETIMKLMDQVLTKISECLTAGGTFISITFQ
ncbi:unnamed protein product, partial [Didymodactylos carnosus]